MDELEITQLFITGQKQVAYAYQLIHKEDKCSKKELLSFRNWFFENAFHVKEVLQNEDNLSVPRRYLFEHLICDYTVKINEIDDKLEETLV